MKQLFQAIKWELILQLRYQIVSVMFFVTLLYIGLFYLLPFENIDKLLIILVLNDPVILGMTFIGALVLFEKSSNTLEALVLTPMKPAQYLWSKAIALTLIILPFTLLMAIVGHGWRFNYLWFVLAVVLSSLVFVFFGFNLVSNAKTLNAYIIKLGIYTIPMGFPIINFLGLTDDFLPLYLIPSQATLCLLEAAFAEIETWKIIYGIVYLLLWLMGNYIVAKRVFPRLTE